jgi:gliding motility-associated-like protein
MMKRTVCFLLPLLFCCNVAFAQQQTNFWYFGVFAALDFSSGSPVVIDGPTDTNEGTASISDASGNLLFFTDATQVWNKNETLMPSGSGLLGDVSSTQVMIVPNPGDSNLYYIFTHDDEGGANGLRYSVVDMSLLGGDGDVTSKNVQLRPAPMTEKLAAVYHCNNHDIWLMAHDLTTNAFVAYLISDTGISIPVISNVGTVHTDVHGQMKFSSDGKKLACAIGLQEIVEILDFDNTTGVVSAPITIPMGESVYGIEFSPDNSKFYSIHYDSPAGNGTVQQFDLSAGSSAAIIASKTMVFHDPNTILRSLQLARDNKIYVTKEITPFLAVINDPNIAGTGCNYVDNAINLDPLGMGNMCKLGLPSFIQSYFNPNFPNIECENVLEAGFYSSDSIICINECIDFTDTSLGIINSWTWSFPGATPASDTVQHPQNICYSAPGTYQVTLLIQDGSNTNIDTITHTILVLPPPTLDAGQNVTIQLGDSTFLNATGNVGGYSWSPATGLSSTTVSDPVAKPNVTTTYFVTGTDTNGCVAKDSVTVTVMNDTDTIVEPEPPCEIFIPTAFSPNGDNNNDVFFVRGTCIEEMRFTLFNRWGEKVFETLHPGNGWDGSYKGKALDPAVFMYYGEITLFGGHKLVRKGNVSLIK